MRAYACLLGSDCGSGAREPAPTTGEHAAVRVCNLLGCADDPALMLPFLSASPSRR
ncbi:MAG: hypothetical protein ACYC91_05035 [Solirubrobacteraceae bacterium]